MKSLVLCACVLIFASSSSSSELKNRLKSAVGSSIGNDAEACVTDNNMTKDDLYREDEIMNNLHAKPENTERTRKNGCWVACILKKQNLMEGTNIKEATSRNNSVAVTSSTVPSSSSTSTAVLGGGAAGMPPPPPPPIVYRGGDRFYPGGSSIHHHHDHHQTGTAAPTLPHVPPPAVYPVHPHQPQQPIHNGPPSSITPPKTSTGQKKKNKEYSDHPNEVVKNEELTYNGASSYARTHARYAQSLILATCSLLMSALLRSLCKNK